MIIDNVFAETDRFVAEKTNSTSFWFVTAHTINGGRFYSEPFKNFEDACNIFDDYKRNVIPYFHGGIVELLRISDFDYDVIAVSRI